METLSPRKAAAQDAFVVVKVNFRNRLRLDFATPQTITSRIHLIALSNPVLDSSKCLGIWAAILNAKLDLDIQRLF